MVDRHRYVVTARFSATEQQHRHQFGEGARKTTGTSCCSARFPSGRRRPAHLGRGRRRTARRLSPARRSAFRLYLCRRRACSCRTMSTSRPGSAFRPAPARIFTISTGRSSSPRVSALLRWAGLTSRLSAGQGFFRAHAADRRNRGRGTVAALASQLRCVAERGRSASIDLTRSLGSLSVTTTLFASNISHPIFVDRGSQLSDHQPSGAPTRNRGAELLATWRKAPFSGDASYTYVRSSELDPAAGAPRSR